MSNDRSVASTSAGRGSQHTYDDHSLFNSGIGSSTPINTIRQFQLQLQDKATAYEEDVMPLRTPSVHIYIYPALVMCWKPQATKFTRAWMQHECCSMTNT